MKKIILSLIIILSIFSFSNVNAMENSFYEGNYIPGEYIVKIRGNVGKYRQMKEFRRSGDDKLAYCIELWETMNDNKTLSGYDFNTNNYPLSFNSIDRVILIAYYGYGYQNHTDMKWYVITQFMIWKELSPDTDLYFTDTLNGNKIDKYANEIAEIKNLVNNHYKVPSFHRNTYNLNYNEWYTITDTNNNLTNFDLFSIDGLEVIKEGNTIKVKSKKIGNSILELVNSDKKYNNNPIVYIDSNGQDLLIPGRYNSSYSPVIFNINSGKLIVNKLDYDTNSNSNIGNSNLNGSIFQLLDNERNIIDTKEVIDNKAIFDNIGYGQYYLKEIKAGEGYNKNNIEKEIIINSDVTSINFYNEVIKNNITIHKYLRNSITSNIEIEPNAEFEIYNDNNKIMNVTTNELGIIELNLPYGTYTVKQVKGNNNYKLADDFSIKVEENNKNQELNIYNESYIFSLRIENLDSDSLKPILESGSSFIIKNTDTLEKIDLITNDEGKTDTINLIPGNYEIIEDKVVDGYIINEDVINININKDNYSEEIEIVIPIVNKKKKSKIEFLKTVEYYLNDILKNSKFDNDIVVPVYARSDIYSKDGIKIYNKDEEVDKVSYDGNNITSKQLVLGDYYVKDLDNKEVDINLDTEDTKRVSFLAKVYEYENNKTIRTVKVENTLDNKNIFEDIYLFFIVIGLFLISKGIKYE